MKLSLSLSLQDYFVLLPQEYYEPSLLKEQVLEPCLATGMSGSEPVPPFCRHYVYPDASAFPVGWADYAEIPGGRGGSVRRLSLFFRESP